MRRGRATAYNKATDLAGGSYGRNTPGAAVLGWRRSAVLGRGLEGSPGWPARAQGCPGAGAWGVSPTFCSSSAVSNSGRPMMPV